MNSFSKLSVAVLAVAAVLTGWSTQSAAVCIIPNVGGTGELPPVGCEYIPPLGDIMQILPPAVPAGNTIDIDPILKDFAGITEIPGGSLGGHQQNYTAVLQMDLSGTGGALVGFVRTISVPVTVETHSAPRTPGDAIQSFATDMVNIQGAIFGDPDFDSLSIVGGTSNGLPSPSNTTLTRLGGIGTDFQVDSFFDISYQIDFQGAPGSILEGMGGRTEGSIRLQIGNPIPEPASGMLAMLGMAGIAIVRCRRGRP